MELLSESKFATNASLSFVASILDLTYIILQCQRQANATLA